MSRCGGAVCGTSVGALMDSALAAPLLSIEILRRDDMAVAMCTGELDASCAATLEARLRRALDEGVRDIVVNLRDVTFMDSAGLEALLRSAKHARWRYGHLFITRPAPQVRRLIRVTGTDGNLRLI